MSVVLLKMPRNHYVLTWHRGDHSSVLRYHLLQPEYVLAPYRSEIKSFKNRKLVSRFRYGCHGLHVDTGNFYPLDNKFLEISITVLSAILLQQRMNTIFFLTALHTAESEAGKLPFSGDQLLQCALCLIYMTPRSLLGFRRNVLNIGTQFCPL